MSLKFLQVRNLSFNGISDIPNFEDVLNCLDYFFQWFDVPKNSDATQVGFLGNLSEENTHYVFSFSSM